MPLALIATLPDTPPTPYDHPCMPNENARIAGGQDITEGQPPFTADWMVQIREYSYGLYEDEEPRFEPSTE